ncbi:hypothetical protein D6D25_00779 [Aureobasidium pullulans]|nr:hypothetical protein D6D25_00779 [Aureobasidium pullulans]
MRRNILPASLASSQTKIAPSAPSPTVSQWQPAKLKKLVGAACEYCRKRRRKCNGEQPCPLCVENNQQCTYEVRKAETHGQALKRKYAQMEQDHNSLKSLFGILASADSQKSLEIHNRIRSGQSPETILQQMRHGDMMIQTRLNSERHAQHVLLSSLMQSNASFDDMVDFIAFSVARNPNARLPNAALLRQLRGQQTDLKGIRNLLGYTQPPPQRRIAIADLLSDQTSSSSESGRSSMDEPDNEDISKTPMEPPFRVPAKPWTTLTDDDEFVSHLISLFLEWVNPFFRPLEEDLFIRAMQSGDLNSEYCSPLLVNSILAYACLYSEQEGAFFQPDDYMTRGQHFHDEAFRLWHLEEGRASIRNVQALCILFTNCVIRGKDKLGVSTCAVLTQLSRDVPNTLQRPSGPPPTLEAKTEYQRARKAVGWGAFACDMATANTILQPAWHITCKEDLPTLSELAPLTTTWTGYPLHNKSDYLDKNIMFIQNCRLLQLTWRAQRLLYASDRSDSHFFNHVDQLTQEMLAWKESLPESLQFHGRLPGPVYDLYSCYASVTIALYSLYQPLGDAQLSPPHPPPTEPSTSAPENQYPYYAPRTQPDIDSQTLFAHTMRGRAITTAQDMALKMGNFRHHYGLKIIPPYFVQANGIACFTLLQDLSTPSSTASFKEAFRCLLGAGMQLLWARGMARMLHLTAKNTGIKLPGVIETMLEKVADTAWSKSDAEMLSSWWPNYVIAKEAKVGESVMMEDLIRKWEKLAVDEEEGKISK